MSEHRAISPEEISRRAYELYLQRGGDGGNEVEDWLKAETELSVGMSATPEKTKVSNAKSK